MSDSGTPGNISNPVVKAVSADGTWRATSWESRSLPRDFFLLNVFLLALSLVIFDLLLLNMKLTKNNQNRVIIRIGLRVSLPSQ